MNRLGAGEKNNGALREISPLIRIEANLQWAAERNPRSRSREMEMGPSVRT